MKKWKNLLFRLSIPRGLLHTMRMGNRVRCFQRPLDILGRWNRSSGFLFIRSYGQKYLVIWFLFIKSSGCGLIGLSLSLFVFCHQVLSIPWSISSYHFNGIFKFLAPDWRYRKYIHIQLPRFSTARGLHTRFSMVGHAKVKVCKSFVFTQKFLLVENIEHGDIMVSKHNNMSLMWWQSDYHGGMVRSEWGY